MLRDLWVTDLPVIQWVFLIKGTVQTNSKFSVSKIQLEMSKDGYKLLWTPKFSFQQMTRSAQIVIDHVEEHDLMALYIRSFDNLNMNNIEILEHYDLLFQPYLITGQFIKKKRATVLTRTTESITS